jgi:hypothetical protein
MYVVDSFISEYGWAAGCYEHNYEISNSVKTAITWAVVRLLASQEVLSPMKFIKTMIMLIILIVLLKITRWLWVEYVC